MAETALAAAAPTTAALTLPATVAEVRSSFREAAFWGALSFSAPDGARIRITLVSGHVPIVGTFDDLPEGSEVTADYEHKTYRWRLTYHGGASGNDLVLINESKYAPDAPVTHVRPMPPIPKPLWVEYPLYPPFTPGTNEPAFPGAEGFDAFTPGGRGGRVITVTNLNDSGPGSPRAAVNTPGPRTIAFKVGGVIALKSPLHVDQAFITLDGEQAPGPGITLRNYGIEVETRDVVLRYLRVRVGDATVHLDNPRTRQAYYDGAGEHVLKDAGAILPRRDAVDQRIVREVRTGTGHVINWVKDVGSWPDSPSTAAPLPKKDVKPSGLPKRPCT